MQEEMVSYHLGDTEFKGYLVYDSSKAGKRPVVIIAHTWHGLDDFVKEKARELAKLGYAGFCADVYGQGTQTNDNGVAEKLMIPLFMDRKMYKTASAPPFKQPQSYHS